MVLKNRDGSGCLLHRKSFLSRHIILKTMTTNNIEPALLSSHEAAWLLGQTELPKPAARNVRYKINRKLRVFMQIEAPLLRSRGFTVAPIGDAAATNGDAQEAKTGRARLSFENTNDNENKSPSRDLNPGPKVSAPSPPFRIMERGITKPSLYQAELLGQNKGNLSSSLFNASR
jgi:hypothetical protein